MNNDMKIQLEERVKNIPKREDVIEYNCPICRDFLYIITKENQAIPCKCKNKVEAEIKLENSGLDIFFKDKTFSKFEADTPVLREAKNISMDYCIKFKEDPDYNKSILLCGQPGAGKTHLGTAIMLNLIDSNIYCIYEDHIKMMINLKQSVLDDVIYNKQLNKYINAKILFLDDFLKGKQNEVDLKYIFEVINRRYADKKPMIISTEKSPEELLEFDEAIGSRIIEMCGGIDGNIVFFEGKDLNYRLR